MELINIHLQLTEECPMSCDGCFQKHQAVILKEKIDPVEALRNAYDHLGDRVHNNTIRLTLFGGEPLTQLEEFKNIIKGITTNPTGPMKIDELFIPTSGFGARTKEGNLTFKEAIIHIKSLTKPSGLKTIISLSYDGHHNNRSRGVKKEKILSLKEDLDQLLDDLLVLPEYVSNVIPEKIVIEDSYDLFSETEHIAKYFGKGSFTIPHTINPEFVDHWANTIYKYFKVINTKNPKEITYPKFIEDILKMVLGKDGNNDGGDGEARWCGAGVNHISIPADTGLVSSCEYLKRETPLENYKDLLEEWCDGCTIKHFCQRPCLKNIELDLEDNKTRLKDQCQIRKINIAFTLKYYKQLNYMMKLEVAHKLNIIN